MATQVERTRTRSQAGAEAGTGAPRAGWAMLAVLLVGQLMCNIDVMVANVAMPSIGRNLHASGASLQLIVGGYTIGYAMLLITGARLGDRYGRRRMYLAGLIAFTAMSLACAVAPDSQALVGFRFAQGAGAAMLVPQIFSIIQLRFAGRPRVRALAAYAAVLSAGATAGLVLGGVLVSANVLGLTWRPVFAINVPIGVVLALAVPRMIPADEPRPDAGRGAARLDIPGLVIGASAIVLLVLPLVLGQESGWPAWTFVSFAAGAAASALFVVTERRVARRGGSPLLNLDVVRSPGLPRGLATLVFTQVTYGGMMFAFTLYLQAGLGESAWLAGVSYVPMAVVFGLTGYYWRRLPASLHHALPRIGLTVAVPGLVALALATHAGHAVSWPAYVALAVIGLGFGAAISPLLTQSLAGVRPERAADASGLLTTSVQLGQLVGVAAIGAIYLGELHRGGPGTAFSVVGYIMAAMMAAGLAVLTLARDGARTRTPRG
ncbi:MAG TPA: MFS transporter [Streptosporangiaceae bacterium]|nr:MFS transporter [Streptosporangiaceae bacterium]